MKRILIISHHFPPEVNGTATRVYEIAKHLININPNINVYILTPAPSRPFGRFNQELSPIKIKRIHRGRIIIFRVWNLQPQLANAPPNQRILNYLLFPLIAIIFSIPLILINETIIIIIPPTPVGIFTIIAKILRKKVIIDITDLWHEEAEHLGYIDKQYNFLKTLSRGLELLSIKISNIVTVASRTIKNYYSKIYPDKNIILFPTPIDHFLTKEHCKKEMDTNDKENIVIYAGNFGKPQALHLAIYAFATLKRNRDSSKLILVGGGEEEDNIKKLITKLRLSDQVKMVPPVPRYKLLEEYYARSKVGLVPLAFSKALVYAIPTKFYEYLACGLPFVSYGSSLELKHLALITNAGIHIDKEDPAEIARALSYVIDHYQQFSRNAKESFEQFSNTTRHLLQRLIE